MKRTIKTIRIACAAVLWMFLPTLVQAQVHIGTVTNPHPVKGALLDLTTSQKLGLLPLNVSIGNINQMPDAFTDKATITDLTALTGLIVYNENAGLQPDGGGLYVWDGAKWNKMKPALLSFNLPDELLLKTAGSEKSKTLTADDFLDVNNQLMNDVTVVWSKVPSDADFTITPNGNTVTVTAGTTASENTFKVAATAGTVTKECEVTVVKLTGDVPDATYNPTMSGSTCWDVREGKSDPGTQSYTITAGSSVGVRTVDWEVVESLPDQLLNSQSGSGNTLTLNYKDRASLAAAAGSPGQTVTVFAYVTYTDNKIVQISKTVKIQNADCCEGTIVYSGKLCWYKSDAETSTWNDKSACASGFRWPTIVELLNLWPALGNSRFFSNIGTNGEVVDFTTDMIPDSYWSATNYTDDRANTVSFVDGRRGYVGKHYLRNVRCVRSL
jgi:hypothetical protein